MSTLTWILKIEQDRARARKRKQRRRISLEGKPENFIAAIRILEMLAATKMKMSGSAKKKKQTGRHTTIES